MATNAIVDVGWIIWLRAAGIDTVAHGCLPNSCIPNHRLEIVNHPVKEILKQLPARRLQGFIGSIPILQKGVGAFCSLV